MQLAGSAANSVQNPEYWVVLSFIFPPPIQFILMSSFSDNFFYLDIHYDVWVFDSEILFRRYMKVGKIDMKFCNCWLVLSFLIVAVR